MFSSSDAERALVAALLAAGAMSSVLVGSALGLYLRPTERRVAVVLGFGAGALIHAIALDLAYGTAEHLVRVAHLSGPGAWTWVAGGFVIGGLLYFYFSRLIEERGGAARNVHLARKYFLERKRDQARELLAHLAAVDVVRSLPPEEMEILLPYVETVRFEPGQIIFHRGDEGDALYFIHDGKVEIDLPRSDASVVMLGPGESFGEMALLAGTPRSATARATEPTELLRIAKSDFDTLLVQSPGLRRGVEALQEQRLVQNTAATATQEEMRHWQQIAVSSIRKVSQSELAQLLGDKGSSSPLAIWLGNVLDTVPGSIVIGAGFSSLATLQPTFLVAVFLANLPEAMASAHTMRHAGYSQLRIYGLWGSLVVMGGVMAALGNVFLADAPAQVFAFSEALAGGAILALVTQVMVPHAIEEGGRYVPLSTIAGFLTAFLLTTLDMAHG
jgi:CRP-like cAMP-binding protein